MSCGRCFWMPLLEPFCRIEASGLDGLKQPLQAKEGGSAGAEVHCHLQGLAEEFQIDYKLVKRNRAASSCHLYRLAVVDWV